MGEESCTRRATVLDGRNSTRTGGSRFLRIWAVAMILIVVLMGSLALFTFGAVCFAGLFFLWLKEKWKKEPTALDRANGAMLLLCVVWFIVNIVTEITRSTNGQYYLIVLALLFPPLLFNLYYLEARPHLPSLHPWRWIQMFLYVAGLGLATAGVVVHLLFPALLEAGFALFLLFSMCALFAISCVSGVMVITRFPVRRGKVTRLTRRMNIMLLLAMALVFSVIIVAFFAEQGSIGAELSVRISRFSRGMPVIFIFVNSYYESRFEFFDVFVKRATLFFLILIGLVGFFAFVTPTLASVVGEAWLRPWVLALILAPAVMAVPTLYRGLENWLDRHWLGRTLTSVDAVKGLFEAVGRASGEAEFIREAGKRFGQIFQTQAQLAIGSAPEPVFQVAQRVPVRLEGESEAEIRLGPRPNETPYFAQDLALIGALSGILVHLWQIMQLQRKRREQEKREQELTLEASRSQLKALRAQINPHFLFNALNVIASLVHRDPDRAEATVEQLAEVFRYTLSRSDEEWVRVEDEVEFIRAYLEVEKARFGDRLKVFIDVDYEVLDQSIPSMMVQTLVENAFKHGLSSVRGVGIIDIRAVRREDAIEIRVSDNGPGARSAASRAKPGGYGLKNIASRLDGYYHGEASMTLERDEEQGLTVAILTLPARPAARSEQWRRA
jgi:two-component sensor histidine kinase